jgi:multimeric flavodoxin WrbA
LSKRVVFIHGSPRGRSNTKAAAKIAMQELTSRGIRCEEIVASKIAFKHPGCISCYKCQQSEAYRCQVDDELARTVATLPDYDAVVLATPIYSFSFPSQLKMLLDRIFSLVKFTPTGDWTSPMAGKALGLLATGGGGIESNLALLEAQWKMPADKLDSPFCSCLIPFTPYEPGALANDDASVAKAQEFGRKLGDLVLG